MTDTTRYDIYAPIHKALRLFMTDTLQCLGRLDLDDAQGLKAGLNQLEELLEAASRHLQHENAFIHPAIERHTQGASTRMASDHREHLETIAALRAEATTLRQQPSPALAHRLYRHLATFVAENFEHMDVEESCHNRTLWAAYDDAAIAAIEGAILASIGPQEMTLWLRWLVPALNPLERVALVRGLPPDTQLPVLHAARPLLGEPAWGELARALAA